MSAAIRDEEQEETVIRGVRKMWEELGQDPVFIERFYRDNVIPLTKRTQVVRIVEVVGASK